MNQPAYWITQHGVSKLFADFAGKIAAWVGTLAGDLKEFAAELLPVALPVLGITLAVFFGVKFIKKVMR